MIMLNMVKDNKIGLTFLEHTFIDAFNSLEHFIMSEKANLN